MCPPWVCINFIEGFLRKSEKEKRGKGCRSPAKETWIGDGRKEKEWENVILLGFYFFSFNLNSNILTNTLTLINGSMRYRSLSIYLRIYSFSFLFFNFEEDMIRKILLIKELKQINLEIFLKNASNKSFRYL